MSFHLHQFRVNNFHTQLNFAVISIAPLPAREDGNLSVVGIFGIAVSVLLTALQLKYQASTDSPFQDHPKTMAIAIASLLILCLGCDVEQYMSSTRRCSTCAAVLHHVLRLLGFVSLASLASVIFFTPTSTIPFLIVYLIFPWFFSARLVLQWVQNRYLQGSRGAYNFCNLDPHFAFSSFFDYVDTLPVNYTASAILV